MSSRFPSLGFDPAPGDPDEVDRLSRQITRQSDEVQQLTDELRRMARSEQCWQGMAAEAFAEVMGDLPQRLDVAGRALGTAARELRGWAATLTELQLQARRVEQDAAVAVARLRAAGSTVASLPVLVDATGFSAHLATQARASSAVDAAQAELDAARARGHELAERADLAGRRAELAIRAVSHHAPPDPGFLQGLVDRAGHELAMLNEHAGAWVREHRELVQAVADAFTMVAAVTAFVPGGQVVALGLGLVALGATGSLTAYAGGTGTDVGLAVAGLGVGVAAALVTRAATGARAAAAGREVTRLPSMLNRRVAVGPRELQWRQVKIPLDQAGHALNAHGVAGVARRRLGVEPGRPPAPGSSRLSTALPGPVARVSDPGSPSLREPVRSPYLTGPAGSPFAPRPVGPPFLPRWAGGTRSPLSLDAGTTRA